MLAYASRSMLYLFSAGHFPSLQVSYTIRLNDYVVYCVLAGAFGKTDPASKPIENISKSKKRYFPIVRRSQQGRKHATLSMYLHVKLCYSAGDPIANRPFEFLLRNQ